jgi:hypothetical protein
MEKKYLHYTYYDYDVENDTNCKLGLCFNNKNNRIFIKLSRARILLT